MKTSSPSIIVAAFAAASALADGGISVSDVSFAPTAQRDVVVNYRLTGTESAVVTIDILTNGVSSGSQNFTTLSGDVNGIVAPDSANLKRIYWKAHKDWPEHKIDSGVSVKVTARALTNPPDYFVLDLESGERKYYDNTNAIPGGISSDAYKTTKLVMRRIPAGSTTEWFGGISWDGSQSVWVDGRGVLPEYMWLSEFLSDKGMAAELQEVGLLKPNPWGLYDMCGNAREICLDRWEAGTKRSDGSAEVDPAGPEADGPNAYRVTKGGSYADTRANGSCGARAAMGCGTADVHSGCRLVCPAVAQ